MRKLLPLRRLPLVIVLLLGVGMLVRLVMPASGRDAIVPAPPSEHRPQGQPVYLGRGLSDAEWLELECALLASGQSGRLLEDIPTGNRYLVPLVGALAPQRVVRVGTFAEAEATTDQFGVPVEVAITPDTAVMQLQPAPKCLVVTPPKPRSLLLHAAHLAAVRRAALFVVSDATDEERLRERIEAWKPESVLAVGTTSRHCRKLVACPVESLKDEADVSRRAVEILAEEGPVRTLVAANPDDGSPGRPGLSTLAPAVAAERRAALLLTNDRPRELETRVEEAVLLPALREVETVLLLADMTAIPTKQRPNPIPTDRDVNIDMEPLTPTDDGPVTFAVGRLFHEHRGVVRALLVRQRTLASTARPRKALMASNPGGSLPLLETLSRTTARELRNVGFEATEFYHKELDGPNLRKLLPEHDIVIWEGHHNTLVRDWGMPSWEEPLSGNFVFLQSCLALQDWKALPLLERGAVGLVGSSSRIYSATGGSFTLAFFNAMLYDGQTTGGALRQAKNFLIAYADLKSKRLGGRAKQLGAHERSAWAFTLWGDPTLRLPLPAHAPTHAAPPVRHQTVGDVITVSVPAQAYRPIRVGPYSARPWANSRLAGLVTREDDGTRTLTPFAFLEVPLEHAPAGRSPVLESELPSDRHEFLWDARRRVGYLLLQPRYEDVGEIRFRVRWKPPAEVSDRPPWFDGEETHRCHALPSAS